MGVSIAHIRVPIAYPGLSIAFTSGVCLYHIPECRLRALAVLLRWHSECVSIAYIGMSIAYSCRSTVAMTL